MLLCSFDNSAMAGDAHVDDEAATPSRKIDAVHFSNSIELNAIISENSLRQLR